MRRSSPSSFLVFCSSENVVDNRPERELEMSQLEDIDVFRSRFRPVIFSVSEAETRIPPICLLQVDATVAAPASSSAMSSTMACTNAIVDPASSSTRTATVVTVIQLTKIYLPSLPFDYIFRLATILNSSEE